MKNYEEFKGYKYRVEFDQVTGQFVNRPLAKQQTASEPILFQPKQKVTASAKSSKKEKRYA